MYTYYRKGGSVRNERVRRLSWQPAVLSDTVFKVSAKSIMYRNRGSVGIRGILSDLLLRLEEWDLSVSDGRLGTLLNPLPVQEAVPGEEGTGRRKGSDRRREGGWESEGGLEGEGGWESEGGLEGEGGGYTRSQNVNS